MSEQHEQHEQQLFSSEFVAAQIGYPFPVNEFGITTWKDGQSLDFVTATASGEGDFLIEAFQEIEGHIIKTAKLKVPFDGTSFDGFIFGYKRQEIPGPAFVVEWFGRMIATLDKPVYMDFGFPMTETEPGEA